LFCSIAFTGFASFTQDHKKFMDANTVWTEFRNDTYEHSLLLFNRIITDDYLLGIYNFQLCLNVYFSNNVVNAAKF